MQNLGGQTKSIMVFSEVAYFVAAAVFSVSYFLSVVEEFRSC